MPDRRSPLEPTILPPRLVDALRTARAAEAAAAGAERRSALRFTRGLLGGAIDAGYAAQALAECLGVSVGAVRNRAGRMAWIAAIRVERTVGADTVARWQADGLLPDARVEDSGETSYPAVDVVRALAQSRRPSPRGSS